MSLHYNITILALKTLLNTWNDVLYNMPLVTFQNPSFQNNFMSFITHVHLLQMLNPSSKLLEMVIQGLIYPQCSYINFFVSHIFPYMKRLLLKPDADQFFQELCMIFLFRDNKTLPNMLCSSVLMMNGNTWQGLLGNVSGKKPVAWTSWIYSCYEFYMPFSETRI